MCLHACVCVRQHTKRVHFIRMDQLGARRIAHGVLAADDPALVAQLAAQGVCLDVCPSSNLMLSVVPSLAEHPLRRLMQAGVACTINSDDPLLFGSSLLQEFELCRAEMRLGDAELAACARASFEHSHAPDAVKERGLRGIEAWCAAAVEPAAAADKS